MVTVRPAEAGDAAAIRQVHLRAFPTSSEAELVERLERDGDSVISLVALDGDRLVGNVVLSRMSVEADGRSLYALGLAPVAVLPERQGQGVGSRLIGAGIDQARSCGAEILFLLGEPDFYGRFGFSTDAARPFASPYAGPYFQALPLNEDYRSPASGTAEYPPAFAALS